MLYDSPCDAPGYYFRTYGDDEQSEDYEDFSTKDLEDQFDELLEVCWESPR